MQRLFARLVVAELLIGFAGSATTLGVEPAPPAATASPSQPTPVQRTFFEKQIRPLLAEHCWKCHGDQKQQGGLRLDSREAILAGGDLGPAATPGDAAGSRIVEVVGYAGDLKMPPQGKLSEQQIGAMTAWVRDGLPWPGEDPRLPVAQDSQQEAASGRPMPWSFLPVMEPKIPAVDDSGWCRSPIDHFVLANLEAAGLRPSRPAERAALIRRAKFDLLGLPPTPEEIDAFVSDDAPDAFARLVDCLLAAPEYGQRWGRHWLDVARYADSNGQDENLAYVNAFRYRDYVVDSLNADKPYDQFVREQLAGDLLPPSSNIATQFARLIATGFLVLGPKMLAEDDPVKMEMDIVDEQVDTVGGTFLGLTLGCARCHDHKFDPISMHDYYALAGIFKSTQTMDNFKVVAQWHERPLGTPDEIQRIAEHRRQVEAKKSELAALTKRADAALMAGVVKRLDEYLLAATEILESPPLASLLQGQPNEPAASLPQTIYVEAEQFARGNVLVDTTSYGAGIGVILNRGELPNFSEYDLRLSEAGWYQIELRYAAAEPRGVQLSIDGNLVSAAAAAEITGSWNPDGQRWSPVGLVHLSAGNHVLRLERTSGPFPHFDRLALVHLSSGTDRPPQVPLTADVLASERELLSPYLKQLVAHLRRAQTTKDSPWFAWFEFRQQPGSSRSMLSGPALVVADELGKPGVPGSVQELAARYRDALQAAVDRAATNQAAAGEAEKAFQQILADAEGPLRPPPKSVAHYPASDREQLASLEKQLAELEKSSPQSLPQAMAVEEGTPTDLRIHVRGSHLNLGDLAPRQFPTHLRGVAPSPAGNASGRRELANWITEPGNPLTSRVLANRVWRWHFGAGLVRSADNFGNLGDAPSHPELLDWLARRFVESGWSIKSLHRSIMLSSTYQMSTAYDASAAEKDPDNRLLWRMNRRRLEAESVRDALLHVGGTLDSSLGGSLLHSKSREYVTSTASVDATNYATNRRSLYLPVVRSALYDGFQAFDFAEPTVIKGDRDSTTIASQALFMMNSSVMQEASARLSARVRGEPRGPIQSVQLLYRLALGRLPTSSEAERAIRFVDRYADTLENQESEREAIAWQALCRVVLSSNEFLYVE